MQRLSSTLINSIPTKIKENSFLSDSVSLSLSNLVVSALNYLFLLAAAYFLSITEFGVLGAAVSILTLLTMLGNIIQLQTTARVALCQTSQQAKEIAKQALFKLLCFSVVPLCLVAFYLNQIASLLNSKSSAVIVLSLSLLALLCSCIANGYTAGIKAIATQARLSIFSTTLKFCIGLVFIFLGFGVAGAIGSYGIGFLTLVLASFYGKAFRQESEQLNKQPEPVPSGLSFPVLFLTYCLLVCPFVFDQLLLQNISPNLSGNYAALGILGKLVFFLCAPILSVIYSHACSATEASKAEIFKKGAYTLCFIIICILVGWSVLGNWVASLLLPAHYHVIIPQIFLFCLGVSAYCINYLIALYAIVLSDYRIIFALIPAVIAQPLLFSNRNNSIELAVQNQLIVYGIQLACLILYMIWRKVGIKSTS